MTKTEKMRLRLPTNTPHICDDKFESDKNCIQTWKHKDFRLWDEGSYYYIAFPLYGTLNLRYEKDSYAPEVINVIQCKRLRVPFSSSDENTIREMLADFVPLYISRLISERRMKSINFIRHEIGYPITAIETISRSEAKPGRTDIHPTKTPINGRFSDVLPYLKKYSQTLKNSPDAEKIKDDIGKLTKRLLEDDKDLQSYVDIMKSVVENTFFITGQDVTMNIGKEPINLFSEIIYPVVHKGMPMVLNNVESVCEATDRVSVFYNGRATGKNYSADQPPIYVDKNRFFQVFFNMLSNAIKYSYSGNFTKEYIIHVNDLPYRRNHVPKNNRLHGIEEPIYDTKWGIEILFSDYGPGIAERCNELIFEDGFRTSEAENGTIRGDGIGLWLARQIIQRHDGEIMLIKNKTPTTFRILLPKTIFLPPTHKKTS